jgi:hypothetical protein
MYLEVMRWRVAGIPGCEAQSRWSKTCRRMSLGTKGWNVTVAVSQRWFRSPTFCVTMGIVQLLAGVETLYLGAEDLVEGHVP